jgi:hypothetical protein
METACIIVCIWVVEWEKNSHGGTVFLIKLSSSSLWQCYLVHTVDWTVLPGLLFMRLFISSVPYEKSLSAFRRFRQKQVLSCSHSCIWRMLKEMSSSVSMVKPPDTSWLIDWFIDQSIILMGWDVHLRAADTNEPVVCPLGDIWRCSQLGKTPDSYTRAVWQSYKRRCLGVHGRNRRRSENFAYQYLRYVSGSLTYHKILHHRASGFTSHQKEGVLLIFYRP